MPQTKILIDTNTYLRLARSINPLLGIPFGKPKFTLYCHEKLQFELDRSSTIKNKFQWIEEDVYKKSRKKTIQKSAQQKIEIENAWDHIWEYQRTQKFSLSKEDIYCIATALVLEITLVTDEIAMIETGKEFDVNVIPTLHLMKIMVDEKFIDYDMVKSTVSYWKYIPDKPANLEKDYLIFFGEKAPD